jgi:DNA-binding transcriptional ArsR family regulator
MLMGNRAGKVEAVEVAAALADPVRLAVMRRLLHGPATVATFTAERGTTQSTVSNHISILRARGLVKAARQGRHVLYRVADHSVAQLVETLLSLEGRRSHPAVPAPIAVARTCYDHLAGRLGVTLLEALWRAGAVGRPDAGGTMELGPAGPRVFASLGVDLAEPASSRRRFAYGCLDWTERKAHTGGGLGAAIFERALEAGWVVSQPGTRAVLVTTAGKRALRRLIGLRFHDRRPLETFSRSGV